MYDFMVKVRNQIQDAPVNRLVSAFPYKPRSNWYSFFPQEETIMHVRRFARRFRMESEGCLQLSVTASPGEVTKYIIIAIESNDLSAYHFELNVPEGIKLFFEETEHILTICVSPCRPYWLLRVKPTEENPVPPDCFINLREAVTPKGEGPAPGYVSIVS